MSEYKNTIPYTKSIIDLVNNKETKPINDKSLEWLLKYENRKEIKNNS
jgi:hypothetical protein